MSGPISVPFVPGPSSWYARVGNNATWLYIGQCESDTSIQITPEYEDVFVDGGGRVPFDSQFMGATASISGDLIHCLNANVRLLYNFLNDPSAIPGTWAPGTIGTLSRTEAKAFGLAIVSTYADKTAFSANNMEAGYWFPFVRVLPIGINLSTRVRKIRLAVEALPLLDLQGGGTLWSSNFNGLSLPDPT